MKKPTDTERLNWLENQNARLQYYSEDEGSLPYAAVFLPGALESGEIAWEESGRGDTFRDAIDDAMEGNQ